MAAPLLGLLAGMLTRLGGSALVRAGASMAATRAGGAVGSLIESGHLQRVGKHLAKKGAKRLGKRIWEGALDDEEMQKVRGRVNAGGRISYRDIADRATLAQMLLERRQERQQNRNERHEAAKQTLAESERMAELARSTGKASLKFVGMTVAAVGATNALNRLAKSSNDATIERLKMFSPQLAMIAAMRDIAAIRREARLAQGVSGTTGIVARAMMDVQDKSLPYQIFGQNISNLIQLIPIALKGGMLEVAEKIGLTDWIRWANDKMPGGEMPPALMHRWKRLLEGRALDGHTGAANRRPNEGQGDRF